MTPQETQDWFDLVKGNKINWSTWRTGVWFIPATLSMDKIFIHGTDQGGQSCGWRVCEGFSPTSLNEYWNLYQQPQTAATPQPTISAPSSSGSFTYNPVTMTLCDEAYAPDFTEALKYIASIPLKQKHICNCQMRDLMRQGCKCGGV